MGPSSYSADLRDIEFVLFEHLNAGSLLGQGRYAHVTRDDVKMILEAGRDFTRDVAAPANVLGDRTGCKWDEGKVTIPQAYHEVWKGVREQGWIGLVAPTEAGGQQLPKVVGTAVDEMFIGANPAFHTYVGLCRAAANLLLHHGSRALIDAYVPKLLRGEWQGTMCLTEAGAGSDVGASLTRAWPAGNGAYRIKGTKVFITSGEHTMTPNHVHLVLARLPEAPPGVKGLSLFLVPKLRPSESGQSSIPNDIYCSKIEEKMGIHGSCTCVLNFGDNDNCLGWLIGEEHQGIRCMFHMMNEERIVVGLQGQALAGAMYANALKYAKERVQGSDIGQGKSITEEKVTIVQHPDVRRMLMNVRALAEGGRALLYAASLENDLAETAATPEERARHAERLALLTPICKAWGSDTGVDACGLALQVYGGSGFIADHPAEQALRDARIATIYEGTNGIQAIDLLFRKVLGAGGKPVETLGAEVGEWLRRHAEHAAIRREVAALGQAVQELGQVTKALAGKARADVKLVALGASPYLTQFGNVVVAWLLLQQAVIAAAKLGGMEVPGDAAARQRYLEGNEEARFYASKIETARFFVHQVLTQNRWKAAQILGEDRSALEVVL
ncbi:MAG: acyl-CoA dehydrogenase [Planctomycetes bacterium]|nr:acyl-CoA dehydrogenase [Planctomycetota bacterium]